MFFGIFLDWMWTIINRIMFNLMICWILLSIVIVWDNKTKDNKIYECVL
jgi:preprotein translocase subunit SecG